MLLDKKYFQFEIVGHPGEKSGCWMGKGSLTQDTSHDDLPGLWIYKINTTKGQSGGAIYLLPPYNKELQEALHKNEEEYKMSAHPDAILLGIHTFGRPRDNAGIKLCKETGDWQSETVQKFWKGDCKSDK